MLLRNLFSWHSRLMFGGLIVCLSVVLAGDDNATAKKAAQIRKTKAKNAEAGMVVSRDPETGQFGSGPGPAVAAPGFSGLTAAPQAEEIRLPNGLVMVRTTEQHMSNSLVTRDAGGNLGYLCVDGKDKAEAIVEKHSAGKKTQAAGKEKGHVRR